MNLKRRENLHEFDLFDILRALQEALHHLWPSKSHVCSSRGQKVAKKSEEMKKKSLAFGLVSGDVLTTFSGLFHILGALQDALHHPWPSKSLVWTSSGQKVAKKPDEMKKNHSPLDL